MAKKKGVPTWVFVVCVIVLIGLNAAMYFGYYLPNTRGAEFSGRVDVDHAFVPGFLIHVYLADEPEGDIMDEITLEPGDSLTVSEELEPLLQEQLSAKYVVRRFEPIELEAVVYIEAGRKIPEDYFTYVEDNDAAQIMAIMASEGLGVGEVIGLYGEYDGDVLEHDDRMLFFPTDDRSNLTGVVYVNFVHKRAEGLIGGPEIREFNVISRNASLVNQTKPYLRSIKGRYTDIWFADDSWVADKSDVFTYSFQRDLRSGKQ